MLLDSGQITIRDALQAIDRGASGAAVVVAPDLTLRGIITDGDCRRHLLGGGLLGDLLTPVLNFKPLTVREGEGRAAVLDLMRAHEISVLPIIDDDSRVVGVHLFRKMIGKTARNNLCVVMAGGRGTRLGEITQTTPKPMVRVAGRPILERLILQFMSYGVTRFVFAVGHMADAIHGHFGDGSSYGCSISYVEDPKNLPLGTAGPLSLLTSEQLGGDPVIVVNGDLITQIDVGSLLERHGSTQADVTVGVHRYRHQVPFGVITTDAGGLVCSLEEKPGIEFQISAGINVFNPSLINDMRRGEPLLMTDWVSGLIEKKCRVIAFEIEDDWIDVGTPGDLGRARGQ